MQQLRQEATIPEYADAFRSIRAAKFWLSLLLFVTLLIYLATFCVAEFNLLPDGTATVKSPAKASNILTPPKPTTTQPATRPGAGETPKASPTPTGAPEPAKPAEPSEWKATVKIMVAQALPALKFLAFVAAILLSLTLLLAFKVSLVGQLGGVSSLVSAFFWSLVLLFFLTPWDTIFAFTREYVGLFTIGVDEIRQRKDDLLGRLDMDKPTALAQYYVKYVAWPGIALLVWLLVMVKFGRGYSRLNFPTAISGASYKE